MSSLNLKNNILECDIKDAFLIAARITGCTCVQKYVEEDMKNRSISIMHYALATLPHGKCKNSTNDPFHKYDDIRLTGNKGQE